MHAISPVFQLIPVSTDSSFELICYEFRKTLHGTEYDGVYFEIESSKLTHDVRLIPVKDGLERTSHLAVNATSSTSKHIGLTLDPGMANLALAREWLRRCRTSQTTTCGKTDRRRRLVRLIDCQSRKICAAVPGQQYVCLSYVWGVNSIDSQESHRSFPGVLPKTVEDAMFVATELGIPFLWVDRYCINQDDPREKHDMIQNMDQTYEGAEITIIAAVGNDPYSGLPGIRGSWPHTSQYSLRLVEHTFVSCIDIAGQVKTSLWNTRG